MHAPVEAVNASDGHRTDDFEVRLAPVALVDDVDAAIRANEMTLDGLRSRDVPKTLQPTAQRRGGTALGIHNSTLTQPCWGHDAAWVTGAPTLIFTFTGSMATR